MTRNETFAERLGMAFLFTLTFVLLACNLYAFVMGCPPWGC